MIIILLSENQKSTIPQLSKKTCEELLKLVNL